MNIVTDNSNNGKQQQTPFEVALELCRRGFSVIPSGGGDTHKAPLVPWVEWQKARPGLEQLAEWENTLHPKLWGIVTGAISDIVVLDPDTKEARQKVTDKLGNPHIGTPRGGGHFYAQHPGFPVKTTVAILPDLDVRADGGFVNVVGSRPDGDYEIYTLPDKNNLIPWHKVAEILQSDLKAQQSKADKQLPKEKGAKIPTGQRNDYFFRLGCGLRAKGMSFETILSAILAAYENDCEHTPPMSQAELHTLAEQAAKYEPDTWEPPEPFVDYSGPSFPVEALPGIVQQFVEAESTALQVPADLIGSLVLGVGAAAAAGRCIVRLNSEWSEPLNLFVVVALPSGERKSPAYRAITVPVEEREQNLVESHRPEIEISKAKRDVLEARLRDAKGKAAKATSHDDNSPELKEVVSLANELAEYQVPKTPRLLADDATSESVASMLVEHGGRIAIMSTEGGLFETLAGRYSDGVANIDVYLKGYSGDPLRVDRKSRPSEFVRRPALTLCLTVQPSVIQDLFSRPLFRGRGLLARFLYSFPNSLVGYRSNTAPSVADELHQAWRRTILDILKLPDPPEGEEHAMTLGNEARAIFQDFRDRAERRLRPTEDLGAIADWGNKFPGTVARIAGILHLLEHAGQANPWEIPLSRVTMESAIAIGNYYADHALIAYGMMGASVNTGLARRLWAIVQHEGLTQFTIRDMHQKKRKSFPLDDLLAAAALLVSMGYLRLVPANSPSGKAGRRPSPVYDVYPSGDDLSDDIKF